MILFILIFLNISFGANYQLMGGTTEFLAVGKPGFLKIKGKGDGPEGGISIQQGQINGILHVNLESLDTGIDLRNQHMKEKYLKTGTQKQAALQIIKIPTELKLDSEMSFEGVLTVANNSKPVIGKFKVANDFKSLTAEFEFLLSDFNIDVPKYAGITVANSVSVKINSPVQIK